MYFIFNIAWHNFTTFRRLFCTRVTPKYRLFSFFLTWKIISTRRSVAGKLFSRADKTATTCKKIFGAKFNLFHKKCVCQYFKMSIKTQRRTLNGAKTLCTAFSITLRTHTKKKTTESIRSNKFRSECKSKQRISSFEKNVCIYRA